MSEEKSIVEAGTEALGAAEAAVEESVEAVIESVSDTVADVVDSAKAAAEETVEAVTDTVAEATESVEVPVEETVEAVTDTVAEATESVEVPAEETVEAVADTVAEATESVEAAAEETVEAVTDTVAEATESVEVPVEETVEAVADTVAEATESVEVPAEETVEAVADTVAEATESVEAAAEETVEAVAKSDDTAKDSTAKDSTAKKENDDKRVVRTLSVGQMVAGRVKRTTEFGAFIDIGVGRDGLVHISELAVGRVQKVTDVLKEGQEVDVWIKKLDRKRNRISLTLISPETTTIKDLNEGDVVEGTVTRIVPYGAFIDLGVGRDGLLHIREMSNGYVAKPEDVVKSGEKTEVRIIALNRKRGRIDLSLKGLRPDDVAEETAAVVAQEAQQSTEEVVAVEEIDVLSPMELAFKKATEAQGFDVELSEKDKRASKRSRRQQAKAAQDEIIARTLDAIND